MEQLNQKSVDALRRKCRTSLFFFARAVLGFGDLCKEIHRPICVGLQDYQRNTRAMIVLPRTWFKSTIGSIAYPVWRAIRDPNVRVLIAQNSMTNAKKKVNAIKSIFETNGVLQALFPGIMPKGDRPWSSECLTVNRTAAHQEGTFEPAGTGTNVTGRHYDLIVEDDTVAPDFDAMTGLIQQPTQMEIEKSIGWHKLCHPLLIHPTKSQIVVIGTRWALEDLIGWILKHGPGYLVHSRSARELNGVPASKEQGGIPIWDRFDEDVLNELAGPQGVGPFMFDMLYMNSPTASVNQVFKRDYIRYYDKAPSSLMYCTSVDPTPAIGQETVGDTDYAATLTTGVNPATGDVYIIHYTREKLDPGQQIDRMFDHWRAYKPLVTLVESVAYQRTLLYWIRRRQEQLNERFYIEEVKNAKASKSARILGLQPWFAGHKVHLRPDVHADLERELLAFDPNKKSGGHDDIIDALSMQIGFWTKSCEAYRSEVRAEKIVDAFSGQAIINELIGRAEKANRYPYDIGHMSERLKDELPREYEVVR